MRQSRLNTLPQILKSWLKQRSVLDVACVIGFARSSWVRRLIEELLSVHFSELNEMNREKRVRPAAHFTQLQKPFCSRAGAYTVQHGVLIGGLSKRGLLR